MTVLIANYCFPTFCMTQNCPVSWSNCAVDKSIVTSATTEDKHRETKKNMSEDTLPMQQSQHYWYCRHTTGWVRYNTTTTAELLITFLQSTSNIYSYRYLFAICYIKGGLVDT